MRWVYLDIGRFGGLAETEGEAIKYRITTPHDGSAYGSGGDRRSDLRRRGHSVREVQLPPAAGAASGDRVELLSAGAYVTTYASQRFNGFAPMAEYYL